MRRLLSVLVLLFLSPVLMWAQADREAQTKHVDEALRVLGSVRAYYQVAISPDGTRVGWVENRSREGGRGTAIYLANASGKPEPRRITAADSNDSYEEELAWSPDSTQVAFLSDAERAGQQQIYVAAVGGKARKLTDLKGQLASLAWSPDGKRLAFLYIENAPRAGGPLEPMMPPSGVMEAKIYEQRLNVVEVSTGKVQAVSPADMYVYEYDWAPDGNAFAAIAAHGDGDNNWWIAQLYRLTVDGRMSVIYRPRLQIANPRIAPDGKSVAFIGGLMSDQGVVGGDIYTVAFAGGEARNLTPDMPASATWLAWTSPDRLLFSEIADGDCAIGVLNTSGHISQLWRAAELAARGTGEAGLSIASDGKTTAVIRSSAGQPPEVWTGPVGSWTQLTQANRDVKPAWGEQRSVHWRGDTFPVQGWLLLPQKFDPQKKYPLVVHVHGGPAGACMAGWPNSATAPFAAAGYVVFCPNPRGSYGQGERFTQANVKDFGGGDLRDILAGVDEVLRTYPVDGRRLGLWGWSYGGYMAMWAETQTHRFGAAVAGAGIANWLSYYGQNDIDQWLVPYFGASVYDDPAAYAHSEPIRFVKEVKTPTLILVGDRDGECPSPQSFEWWHALKTYRVPVEFVVYPGEGHAIRKPEHRRDVILRSVLWFDRWLPEERAAAAAR